MSHPGRWPEDFRQRAVMFYLSRRDEMSVRAVAYELGVPANTLRRWIRQHENEPRSIATEEPDSSREVARLTRENRALREENEILKKAAAFFARETGSNPPRRSGS